MSDGSEAEALRGLGNLGVADGAAAPSKSSRANLSMSAFPRATTWSKVQGLSMALRARWDDEAWALPNCGNMRNKIQNNKMSHNIKMYPGSSEFAFSYCSTRRRGTWRQASCRH